MLIAHAPAGYLLSRVLARTVFKNNTVHSVSLYRNLILAGMLGGILPDIDFIYQGFIDPAKTPHHSYITHMPVLWLSFMCLFSVMHLFIKNSSKILVLITLCSSAFLHMICDTTTGIIYWLYPLSHKGFNIFSVSGTHIWWVHNYMYHWTFLFEIAIIFTAMAIFLRVKDTVTYFKKLFRHDKQLRSITIRIAVCIAGISVIVAVGSLKFNVDNMLFHKAMELKHRVAKVSPSL